MAGAQVGIFLEDDRAVRLLRGATFAALDLRVPFGAIGASLVTSTQHRITDEKASPDGEAWAPASPAYALAKARKGKDPSDLLRSSGLLLAAITHIADRSEVAVGVNKTYAAIQQLGGEEDMAPGPAAIPARPFLGTSEADDNEIGNILVGYFGKTLT